VSQLRRGAREQLDHLYCDLDDIERHAHDNPAAVERLVFKVRRRLQREIEPMLERASAAPPLEDRVKALEDALEELKRERVP
jgi:hypothetical protein